MFYHASPTAGIRILEPRISNHGRPLIYFSRKRENVLVYLSNAVEKYCRENGFIPAGPWQKWGPYGFDRDGVQRIDEYYPGALEEAYRGVSGYIYTAEKVKDCGFQVQIPDAVTAEEPVPVTGCEFVPDAYEEILKAEGQGLIRIRRFEETSAAFREWNRKTVREEYAAAVDHPEYRFFLEGKFGDILKREGRETKNEADHP